MANTYNGTTGNDTMKVLDPAGRHGETATWNGGAGTDTLNFAVHSNAPGRAVFTFVQNGSSITMSGVTGGSSWTYTLNSIEEVRFKDQTINLTSMFPSAFGDTVAPTATFSPANNAVDVSNTANIVVTFNEAVKFGTGTITITETGTNNVIATYNTTLGMANNANVSISGTTLTINPTADLGLSTGYTVALSSGSIKDTAGNNYAGNVATNYHFTTAAGPVITGTANSETLTATDVSTIIHGLAGNDTLTGGAGDDDLYGDAGNDSLIGGTGADTMTGGAGNDTYVVGAGDIIAEAAGAAGGIDSVQSSITYSLVDTDGAGILGGNIENLTLTGIDNIDGTGNAMANTLTGNAGNNILDGGAGLDKLIGGAGNDTYSVDLKSAMVGLVKVASLQDSVTEALDAGTDTIVLRGNVALTTASAITLGANIEKLDVHATGTTKLNLTGNLLANTLTGNDAANVLNGGLEIDTLIGGLGNDIYVVDNTSDVVIESSALSTEIDTVKASASYTLTDNVEKLTLTGTAAINATGNALNNTLAGNAAANRLDGGTGADSMSGGNGNDIYVVDNLGDKVVETALVGSGIDEVQSSVDYTLGLNLEKLTLTGTAVSGTGNTLSNTITGNASNNSLIGGAGNDTINGGVGADSMSGGTGNDTFEVDDIGDVIVDVTGATGGVDTVKSSITYSLFDTDGAGTLGGNIENLTLTGIGNIDGTGNTLKNRMTGNDGNNSLDGGAGIDTLAGGLGNDTLTGGADADVFMFNTALNSGSNLDIITDFTHGSDHIYLENAIFNKLTITGVLKAANFYNAATGDALDANDYIGYNSTTGALYYDADGNGAGAAVQFATLSTHPTLTVADIVII